ncbi:MAG: hypothetical protein C4527_24645 [Candidatus Omnitrophota bacterium]|jgi:general stress protein 26|nr:MAG: hypothetical protein C4527_24645 [Candidatus Omnitrophota bacterium]
MNIEELKIQARKIVRDRAIFFLGTNDGGIPRVRAMTCLHADGFCVWTTTHKESGKMREIEKQNVVEACFLDAENRQVRILGEVKVFEDEKTWDSLPISPQFTPMVEDLNYVLLRIEPKEVRMVNDWSLDYKTIPID